MEAGSPEASNVDSLSGRSDADNWSAGTSPPWPEHHTRTSVSPGHDPDPEGPESPVARHGVTDEEDIDFHFGMRASVDVDLTRAPGRPKAAAKMLVRSGLRCPKCLLKTWVCLCNRAPRELDRRGTAPRPYERYWLFCLPCRHFVVPFRPPEGGMLLASSTLRFSRSSASPLAGGNHSAVSRGVSETSVSEDKSSRCPLSSLNYLAAFHALQLLQNSPQPQAGQIAAESRSQVRARALLWTSYTTSHIQAPGGEGFASFRRGRGGSCAAPVPCAGMQLKRKISS